MQDRATQDTLVYSELGGDPELAELVDMFVGDMPDRIRSLQDALASRDMSQLSVLAHQMKGAAGCYGFSPISPVAAELEKVASEGLLEAEINRCVQDLVEICGQVRAGNPN